VDACVNPYGEDGHKTHSRLRSAYVVHGRFASAAHQNDEVLLVIDSPLLAAYFTREMDRLWDTAELGITPHIKRKIDR